MIRLPSFLTSRCVSRLVTAALIVAVQALTSAAQSSNQQPPGKPVGTFVDFIAPPEAFEALASSATLIARGRPHSPQPTIVGSLGGLEYRVTLLEVFKDGRRQQALGEVRVVEVGGGHPNNRGVPTIGEPPAKIKPDAECFLFLSVWPAATGYAVLSGGAFSVDGPDVVIPKSVSKMKAFGTRADPEN